MGGPRTAAARAARRRKSAPRRSGPRAISLLRPVALLVLLAGSAWARIVASDLGRVAPHRLHLGVRPALRFARLRGAERGPRSRQQLPGIVEGQVAVHRPQADERLLGLAGGASLGGHAAIAPASAGPPRRGNGLVGRWRRSVVVRSRGHGLREEDPAQDLLVDAV